MAINKLRNATVITDADGDKYYFTFGINAIAKIQKVTGLAIDQALTKAFGQSAAGDGGVEPATKTSLDFDLIRTLVRCTVVEPDLTDEDIGLLIADVGLEPLMEVFSKPSLGGAPKEGAANPTGASS